MKKENLFITPTFRVKQIVIFEAFKDNKPKFKELPIKQGLAIEYKDAIKYDGEENYFVVCFIKLDKHCCASCKIEAVETRLIDVLTVENLDDFKECCNYAIEKLNKIGRAKQ